MSDELRPLRDRLERLRPEVGPYRDRLIHCIEVAGRPQDTLTLARAVAESLAKQVLSDLGIAAPSMLDACLRKLEEPAVMSRAAVPAEVVSLLHMVRVLGNKSAHEVLNIEVTAADVDLVLRSTLRVVEWYFVEFDRGPRLELLFRPGEAPPPLKVALPPLAARMPPIVIEQPRSEGPPRKTFVFTDRLLGLGREKTSRDPRVRLVTRLLPCPGPQDPNWNRNLENIDRFHAQLWWQMGRVEVRDEDSDKGVLLNGEPIAPGTWTLCSLPEPAIVRLGPAGVELRVSESVRTVEGIQVQVVGLTRQGNWPWHQYLMVSHPLVSIGPDPGCVAVFPEAEGPAVLVRATPHGWVLDAGGSSRQLDPATSVEDAGLGLLVRRAREEDFLS